VANAKLSGSLLSGKDPTLLTTLAQHTSPSSNAFADQSIPGLDSDKSASRAAENTMASAAQSSNSASPAIRRGWRSGRFAAISGGVAAITVGIALFAHSTGNGGPADTLNQKPASVNVSNPATDNQGVNPAEASASISANLTRAASPVQPEMANAPAISPALATPTAVAAASPPPTRADSRAPPETTSVPVTAPAPAVPTAVTAALPPPPRADSLAPPETTSVPATAPAPAAVPTTVAAAPPPPTQAASPAQPETAASPAQPETAATPAPKPVGARLSSEEVAALLARGDALFNNSDIVSARLCYELAAEADDARAAIRLGETYDPAFLARARLNGVHGDAAMAVRWYRRARELGAAEAEALLTGVADFDDTKKSQEMNPVFEQFLARKSQLIR
jgi:hypothetical protein